MGGIELRGFRAFRLGFWGSGFGSGSGSGSGLQMVLDCVRGGGGEVNVGIMTRLRMFFF